MNEHILRLANQAFDLDESGEMAEQVPYGFMEEFAKLIVLECTAYLNGPSEVYNQNEQDVCDRNARLIKQYFGIE